MTITLPFTVGGVLDRAADLIGERGLNREYFGVIDCDNHYLPNCPLCVIGAIQCAVTGYPDAMYRSVDQNSLITKSISHLCQHLDRGDEIAWVVVSEWNDRPGRTAEQVVGALRAAAQSWRDGAR